MPPSHDSTRDARAVRGASRQLASLEPITTPGLGTRSRRARKHSRRLGLHPTAKGLITFCVDGERSSGTNLDRGDGPARAGDDVSVAAPVSDSSSSIGGSLSASGLREPRVTTALPASTARYCLWTTPSRLLVTLLDWCGCC